MGSANFANAGAKQHDVEQLRRLALYQRYAMIAMLVFLGSIPVLIGASVLDFGLRLPIDLFFTGLTAFQILFFIVMSLINWRLGKEMKESWVPIAIIASACVPCVALICLFTLSQEATYRLRRAGVRVGILGANLASIS
jgi:hypothetical protein